MAAPGVAAKWLAVRWRPEARREQVSASTQVEERWQQEAGARE